MSLSLLFSTEIMSGKETRVAEKPPPVIPGRTPPGARVALQQSPILLAGKSH